MEKKKEIQSASVFASLDLANHEWKNIWKKQCQRVPRQNLNLPQTGNHAHSIYTIFPTTFT